MIGSAQPTLEQNVEALAHDVVKYVHVRRSRCFISGDIAVVEFRIVLPRVFETSPCNDVLYLYFSSMIASMHSERFVE